MKRTRRLYPDLVSMFRCRELPCTKHLLRFTVAGSKPTEQSSGT